MPKAVIIVYASCQSSQPSRLGSGKRHHVGRVELFRVIFMLKLHHEEPTS